MMRDISGYAAFFTTIYYCQRNFDQIGLSPVVGSFVAGGLAGMVLWFGFDIFCQDMWPYQW